MDRKYGQVRTREFKRDENVEALAARLEQRFIRPLTRSENPLFPAPTLGHEDDLSQETSVTYGNDVKGTVVADKRSGLLDWIITIQRRTYGEATDYRLTGGQPQAYMKICLDSGGIRVLDPENGRPIDPNMHDSLSKIHPKFSAFVDLLPDEIQYSNVGGQAEVIALVDNVFGLNDDAQSSDQHDQIAV